MEPGETRGRGRRGLMQMVAVGVVATALGIVLGLAINWFPAADATQADKIDTLWDVLVIVSVPIFVLVTVVVVFSVIDFRMRPGEEGLDGPPIHGNTRLEVLWTAIPAILILGLCTYAYVVLTDIEEAPASGAANERRVVVTGQQFTWTFSYNERGRRFTTPQLYLPAGESVKFIVRSRDVIHDFWVPDFRMKIDAVPGIDTTYRVTVKDDAIGDHDVVCAELCGLGHAYMRQTVHVMAPRDFTAWVARQGRGGRAGGGTGQNASGGTRAPSAPIAAAQAKQLFVAGDQQSGATACGACHTLPAAGTSGQTGPDLGTALKGKDLAFIKRSIENPDAEVASGYPKGIMPQDYAQTLSDAQVDGLSRWLEEVAAR